MSAEEMDKHIDRWLEGKTPHELAQLAAIASLYLAWRDEL